MQKNSKIIVLLLLVIAVVAVVAVKNKKSAEKPQLANLGEQSVEERTSSKEIEAPAEGPAEKLNKEQAKNTDAKMPAEENKPASTPDKSILADQKGVKKPDVKPQSSVANPDKTKTVVSGKPRQQKMRPAKLIELGSTTCVPCKKMLPLMGELKRDYAGKLEIVTIDIHEDEKAVDKYDINMIPAQIFFDSNGKEIFRHEGFFSKEDIIEAFKSHGVDLASSR
ncbi:MAG: thioredoxin family protein [Armatimonadota bacterium]